MALRWAAAGMTAAQAQFRRVKGHRQLPELGRALERAVGYEPAASDVPHAATWGHIASTATAAGTTTAPSSSPRV